MPKHVREPGTPSRRYHLHRLPCTINTLQLGKTRSLMSVDDFGVHLLQLKTDLWWNPNPWHPEEQAPCGSRPAHDKTHNLWTCSLMHWRPNRLLQHTLVHFRSAALQTSLKLWVPSVTGKSSGYFLGRFVPRLDRLDYPGGVTADDRPVRHIFRHHSPRPNDGTVAHCHPA